jgi:hypothetical protein
VNAARSSDVAVGVPTGVKLQRECDLQIHARLSAAGRRHRDRSPGRTDTSSLLENARPCSRDIRPFQDGPGLRFHGRSDSIEESPAAVSRLLAARHVLPLSSRIVNHKRRRPASLRRCGPLPPAPGDSDSGNKTDRRFITVDAIFAARPGDAQRLTFWPAVKSSTGRMRRHPPV